jgi:hypothetical protein
MSKTLKTNLKGDESMTTCVNQEKKGYAGKAVSATLAGVLAVGMVPAAAFAEAGEGEAAAEGASLELLSLSDNKITNGTIAFNDGYSDDMTFVLGGSAYNELNAGSKSLIKGVTLQGETSVTALSDLTGYDVYYISESSTNSSYTAFAFTYKGT